MPTVDVIPESVFNNFGNDSCRPEYLAPVPAWWIAKSDRERLGLFCTHTLGKQTWVICRVPYCEDIGFDEESLGLPSSGEILD
jgi:CRISPR-associated endonuclease/helicase Cas3